jgi:hypothetical protein
MLRIIYDPKKEEATMTFRRKLMININHVVLLITVKSRRIQWTVHLLWPDKTRKVYIILMGKSLGK